MRGVNIVYRKIIKINRSRYVGLPAHWSDLFNEGDQVKITRHGTAVIVERVE
ncbi:MAG: hypothetical protein ACYTEQ_19495 [Planctomycetota bacterium]|jgi:virulence-associated protein VagC